MLAMMQEAGLLASASCAPLYSKSSSNNQDPAVWGTGTLLRIGSHHLMLTAGHVADLSGRECKTLWINRGSDKFDFLSLSSKIRYAVNTPADGGEDLLDVAVIDLPPEHVAALEGKYKFLTLDQLDPGDSFSVQPAAYMVAGYPASLSGPGATTFTTNGMVFGGIRYAGNPALIPNFSPDLHVAIEYSDQGLVDLEGTRVVLPDPGGASGGAIWRIIENGKPLAPRLVGLIRRREMKPSVIIGTQIEYALGLIWRSFPGTASVLNMYVPWWECTGWKRRA
jgi:hypothetical protein